jgi:hypothetical protein
MLRYHCCPSVPILTVKTIMRPLLPLCLLAGAAAAGATRRVFGARGSHLCVVRFTADGKQVCCRPGTAVNLALAAENVAIEALYSYPKPAQEEPPAGTTKSLPTALVRFPSSNIHPAASAWRRVSSHTRSFHDHWCKCAVSLTGRGCLVLQALIRLEVTNAVREDVVVRATAVVALLALHDPNPNDDDDDDTGGILATAAYPFLHAGYVVGQGGTHREALARTPLVETVRCSSHDPPTAMNKLRIVRSGFGTS